MFRVTVILALIVAGVTLALALHHPPMRLMPAPQVFLKDGSAIFAANPVPADNRIEVFYATNRLPAGTTGARVYGVVPGRDMYLGTGTIRIGDEGTLWDDIYALSVRESADERPFLHLETMREEAVLSPDAGPGADVLAWLADVDRAVQASRDKDIIIYVHGANTTVERGIGQAAQLQHFTGRNSVVVSFVWPTAENFLRYGRDIGKALSAAPHLARLVQLLSEHTSARSIDVMTYSAGAMVGSEGLRILAGNAAATPPRLGEVYHAAPDADFRRFVADMRDYDPLAERVSVSANMNDSALRLSQTVTRASRAGRPDFRELDPEETRWLVEASRDIGMEAIHVRAEDIPDLSRTSHAFWYDDPWVSSDVLISLLFHLPAGERGLDRKAGPSGGEYWTFPQDYPERLGKVMEGLRPQE